MQPQIETSNRWGIKECHLDRWKHTTMLYLIDTEPWTEQDVQRECAANNIEFRGGFHFHSTCTKLASHLVKQQVAQDYSVTADLEKTDKGKPFFDQPNIHFNITHHNRLVVAVASTTQQVGIDVTDLHTPFNREEMGKLFTEVPPKQLEGFYWAAREAYLKYTGEGTQEAPLTVQKPAHMGFPDIEELSSISVMPFMKIERSYVRLFKVRDMVGAVVAAREDVTDICSFNSEIQPSKENIDQDVEGRLIVHED